jgi:hypothetical protein
MATFPQAKQHFLAQLLNWANGLTSHDTFSVLLGKACLTKLAAQRGRPHHNRRHRH